MYLKLIRVHRYHEMLTPREIVIDKDLSRSSQNRNNKSSSFLFWAATAAPVVVATAATAGKIKLLMRLHIHTNINEFMRCFVPSNFRIKFETKANKKFLQDIC